MTRETERPKKAGGISFVPTRHMGQHSSSTDARLESRCNFTMHVIHVTSAAHDTTHDRYTIKSSDAGVGVSYSAMRRVVSLERVSDAYAADLSVSANEGVTDRHIVK